MAEITETGQLEDCDQSLGDLSLSEETCLEVPLLSPASMYKETELRTVKRSLVRALVLSSWDNIMGPRIEHVWLRQQDDDDENGPPLTSEMYQYIGTHTLTGEICRDMGNPHIDSKFYMLKHRNVMVLAVIFGAATKSGYGVHSLGVVMPCDDLETYLTWYELILNHITKTVLRFRVLREKNSQNAVNTMTEEFNCLQSVISSLYENPLPTDNQKLFSESLLDSVKRDEVQFFTKTITSHLTTFGHSVIIGDSADEINKFISTIALFNSTKEIQCSRYLKTNRNSAQQATQHHPYTDLYVQGILKEEPSSQDLLSCLYPTTVVNVNNRTVRQTALYHEHTLRRYELIHKELTDYYQSENEGDSSLVPTGVILNLFDSQETFVTKLVQELISLPIEVRAPYIDNFNRYLQKLALTLIKAVECETNWGENTQRLNLKKIRHNLGLLPDGDFRIILAAAEKLKSGFFGFVMGDMKRLTDDLIKQIETF